MAQIRAEVAGADADGFGGLFTDDEGQNGILNRLLTSKAPSVLVEAETA